MGGVIAMSSCRWWRERENEGMGRTLLALGLGQLVSFDLAIMAFSASSVSTTGIYIKSTQINLNCLLMDNFGRKYRQNFFSCSECTAYSGVHNIHCCRRGVWQYPALPPPQIVGIHRRCHFPLLHSKNVDFNVFI